MKTRASYYEVLRVTPSSSDAEIKRAYHTLAKKFHPDRNPNNRRVAELRFRAISEAYAHLKTKEKRIAYNQELRAPALNDNANSGFFSQIGEIFWPKTKEIKE